MSAYDDYELARSRRVRQKELDDYHDSIRKLVGIPNANLSKIGGLAQEEMKQAAQSAFAATPEEKKAMALYKYEVEGTMVYGKRLAIDGVNWVMKASTGAVHVIAATAAEEVRPYTVAVRFLSHGGSSLHKYHYAAKEGEVAVGDLLFLEGTSGLATVVEIGTKYKSSVKPLSGWKLAGSPLTTVEVENE